MSNDNDFYIFGIYRIKVKRRSCCLGVLYVRLFSCILSIGMSTNGPWVVYMPEYDVGPPGDRLHIIPAVENIFYSSYPPFSIVGRQNNIMFETIQCLSFPGRLTSAIIGTIVEAIALYGVYEEVPLFVMASLGWILWNIATSSLIMCLIVIYNMGVISLEILAVTGFFLTFIGTDIYMFMAIYHQLRTIDHVSIMKIFRNKPTAISHDVYLQEDSDDGDLTDETSNISKSTHCQVHGDRKYRSLERIDEYYVD